MVKRDLGIDILRGLAVALMLLTHSIAFFHIGDDAFVNLVGNIGGTVSFGLFLFIFGVAHYMSYIRLDALADADLYKRRRHRILYGSIGLLIGYYVVATIASIPKYAFPPNLTWVDNITQTLFFIDVPPFTEFILAFVLIGISVIALRKFYRFSLKYPPFLIGAGLFLFVVGQLLFPLQMDGLGQAIKALFVGENDWHRFPMFQYMIVYFVGLIWGRFLAANHETSKRIKFSFISTLIFVGLTAAGVITFNYIGFSWLSPTLRWPPALTFMGFGLVASFLLYFLILVLGYLKALGPIQVFIHYMGTKSLNFFIFHTLVLYVYKYATNDSHFDSPIIVFMLFLGLVMITGLLSMIKESIISSLKSETGDDEGIGWLFSERVAVTAIWVVIILLGGMAIYQGSHVAAEVNPDAVSFKKDLIREQSWPFWWDHSYGYFQELTIHNDANDNPLLKNTWVSFGWAHKNAVAAGQSQSNGSDVRIVYFDDKNGFIELPFVFENIGKNSTIKFKLSGDIPGHTNSDKYFLYYGNSSDDKYPVSKETPISVASVKIDLSSLYSPKLSGKSNRKWILKQGSTEQRTLLYTVQLDKSIPEDSLVSYKILNTSLRGSMDSLGGRRFQASIKISELDAGVYQIQAVARPKENKLKLYESSYTSVNLSYPLYVVWTQDWEGTDVDDYKLNGLNNLANKYQIPLTHFFNPRIYVSSAVKKARADLMTLWVINRQKYYGDDIQLHLHMWYDMVAAAGVKPIYGPTVPWLYRDGGGVPASLYSVEDFKKILNWSRQIFLDNGLDSPIAFRAGGWFADTNTFKSLEEAGFQIDSSGRTYPSNARQQAYPPPWNLKATTQPFKPNRSDINSSKSPTFNVWEFPNNGADSYWYNTNELINRFDQNYPHKGAILTKPVVVTYLSHPPFFVTDQPKMNAVFAYIQNFINRDDKGPVVYSNLSGVFDSWDRSGN